MTFVEFLQTLGTLFAAFVGVVVVMFVCVFVMLRLGWREREAQMDRILQWFEDHPLPAKVHAIKWIDGEAVVGWYDPRDTTIIPLIPIDPREKGLPEGYSGTYDPMLN
jgi:hypothetical protein